jgi:hypothetical protein
MKLIIENFKRFLNDDEFAYNHNLFVDFIKNDLNDEDRTILVGKYPKKQIK